MALKVLYVDFSGVTQQGTIEVNKELVNEVRSFFTYALELKFPIEKVVRSSDAEFSWDDSKLTAANATSGFNYRLIKGTDRPSLHALGRAFDVNCRLNPYIGYKEGEEYIDPPGAVYDVRIPGTLTSDHPLVTMIKGRGWTWGGDWTPESGRVDYQHFEKPE